MNHYKRAFEYLMEEERGFVWDPRDPGGPTKFGITQTTLSRWRGVPVSPQDVANMESAEASQIYYHWYWQPLGCPELHSAATATAILTTGVLFGIVTVMRLAQHAANEQGCSLIVDGYFGPKTEDALNGLSSDKFIASFCSYLTEHVKTLVEKNINLFTYKKGWLARVKRLCSLSSNF